MSATDPGKPNMGGRPSTYTAELAEAICERLATGESLRRICMDKDLPNERTVRRWALDDKEGFQSQYTSARDMGLDSRADEIMDIADEGTDPVRDRLKFDARRWYLSKLAPKRYGDKLTQEHTGPGGGPILTARDLTDDELAARIFAASGQ